ncbi:hypothetical protein BsWGS_15846 [Bradybaena similaris]
MVKSPKPAVSFYIDKEDVQGKTTKLWRPAKVSVNSPPETYKPYPLLMNLIMPSYPKMPLPQPWGVSVIRDVKLARPVYPHPPDLGTFTTQTSLVLAKYYENNMRATDSSQKHNLQY